MTATRSSALLLLALAGGLAVAVPAARGEAVEGIAAIVGDDIILVSEVQERAASALAQAMHEQSAFIRDQTIREIMGTYLQRLIDELLIQQEATRLMLDVTDEEVERAMAGIRERNGWDEFAMENELAQRGETVDQYRQETRIEVLKYKVLSVRLRGRLRTDDEEVRRAYRQIVRASRSNDTVELAQIVFHIPGGASAIEMSRLQEKATAVARRAQQGEDFAQLARDFSDDTASAARGGSLGTLHHGELPASIDEEIVALNPGDVAGPVRGPDGFYVLKVIGGDITGVRSFDDARQGIENQIMEQMMQRQEEVFLDGLRRKTYIDVRLQ